MVNLVSSSLATGVFWYRDDPGTDRSFATTEFARGAQKTFIGQRGGKFPKGSYPPPLNPVTISDLRFESKTVEGLQLVGVPVWGSRYFNGDLGAMLAGTHKVRDLLPGHHAIDTQLRDFSLQKAYARIEQGDFNSQLFLAELGETVSMLRNPLNGLYKIHAKYRRSRKKIKDLLKATTSANADVYLQYMFGVAPLINDIKDIYELVMEKATARNQLYGKARTVEKKKFEQHYSLKDSLGFHSVDTWATATTETKMTGKVYYAMSFGNPMYDLIRKWGLNPLTLPITMWETVPLSFVVDWFFGVKQWLQAIMPRPGVTILGNCVSEKLIEDVSIDRVRVYLSPGTYGVTLDRVLGSSGPLWKMHNERLIREVNLPIPTSIYAGAGLDSLGKAVTSAALAIQKIKL